MITCTRNIGFMACPEEDFPELLRLLMQREPGARWTLVCFYPPPVPLEDDIEIISSRRSFRTAVKLWVRCATQPVERMVVCCRDLDVRTALRPIMEFMSVCRARQRLVLDVRGRDEAFAAAGPAALAALATVPLLLFTCVVVTRLGLALWRGSVPSEPLDAARGRTAILVPVVPDLSHTFVYREVLALKRRHPEYLVLALDRGDSSVVHGEAAELLTVAEFVPRLSATRYLVIYLGTWLRRPRAMASLIRFFQPHTASFGSGARSNDALCFLRLEHLLHSNYLALGFMLAECLRKKHVSYLHVYGSTSPSVRALIAHRLTGIPYSVSTYVDFDYWTPFHMLEPKLRHARFVVACTDFCARRLTERLPDLASKYRVLHHSLPGGYGASPGFRAADGRSRLVYIGRFVPKKGIDLLIRACRILSDSGLDVTCHLYGAGPEEGRLRRLIAELELEDGVVVHPGVPNQDFYTTMNRDDVFVCPARYMEDGERDGIPVTLLEAMAAGVTVVATPVSGIPELIVDGENGYLVPADDPGRLAGLLSSLIREPHRREVVSASAMRTIREQFSLEEAGATLDRWISRETASQGEMSARPTAQTGGRT